MILAPTILTAHDSDDLRWDPSRLRLLKTYRCVFSFVWMYSCMCVYVCFIIVGLGGNLHWQCEVRQNSRWEWRTIDSHHSFVVLNFMIVQTDARMESKEISSYIYIYIYIYIQELLYRIINNFLCKSLDFLLNNYWDCYKGFNFLKICFLHIERYL